MINRVWHIALILTVMTFSGAWLDEGYSVQQANDPNLVRHQSAPANETSFSSFSDSMSQILKRSLPPRRPTSFE